MVGRTTLTVIVVCFLLTALIPFFISQEVIAQQTEKIEVTLSARGTFLLADPFESGMPEGGSNVEDPLILDLEANGILGDMPITIDYEGQICIDAFWFGHAPVYISAKANYIDLLGVFSTDSQLSPFTELNRIPGAIDYGEDYLSDQTNMNLLSTDIPQDFKIVPNNEIIVPHDAKYLFFCIDEGGYYPDNLGTIQINIEYVADMDGDGLLDSWEKNGIDFDQDGNIDLDLPMLGADWEHKDIFVEADYMAGKAPNQDAINDVKAVFYNAQVSNPDGIKGINLHVLIDEEVPWTETLSFIKLPIFTDFYDLKKEYFGTEDDRSNPDAIKAKKMVYRYCIFANKIWLDPKCPGIAEGILCDDFILAFGAFSDGVGSREFQAAVFMHELGHTLGLGHGGNTSVNFKPNYLSIMNYAFAYNQYVPTRPLDYSYGKCSVLDESDLDEFYGIGQAKATIWMGPNNTLLKDPNGMTIDWENNGWIDNRSVKMNVNNKMDFPSPPGEILTDFNDWANLIYKFRGTPLYVASATPEDYHIELTTDQIEQMEEEAVNMIVVDSPTVENSDAGLPIEAVLGIVVVATIVIVVAVLFFMRKKKK